MDEIFHYQSFCAENHENKLIAAKKLSVIAVLQGRECNEKELLYRNRQLKPQASNGFCKHQKTCHRRMQSAIHIRNGSGSYSFKIIVIIKPVPYMIRIYCRMPGTETFNGLREKISSSIFPLLNFHMHCCQKLSLSYRPYPNTYNIKFFLLLYQPKTRNQGNTIPLSII